MEKQTLHGIPQDSTSNLTNQKQEASIRVSDGGNLVVEYQEVCEPHTGTHVVKNVPNSIGQLAREQQVGLAFLYL